MPAKAARKRFEEGQTTLEQAEPYRILTATMPVDALTADWSMGSNRPIQEKHVDALYTIFQRGDMKRASYPLAVLSTLELLGGQRRVAALKRLASGSDAGKQELYWPCNIYDHALPPELNLALRMNRRDPTMAESPGDIWVQLATAVSERPAIFHGTVAEMEEQMLGALRLSGAVGFPLPWLVTIWRNERWQQMTTRWCETTVGCATFQLTTWDWMICHRTDDVF
ncbi:DNA repair protein rad10 [Purpureocillium lavendulum]|uniref:DNA repair protein rad10 n=1 Tax=Purpureocillium lavendulum TaxID=1247861 RepID=A0AB34FI33_9HYPO|nr:DNA repair protein rad10 [Purpureocillium lavendulum]